MNHPTEANHELTIGWRDKDDSYARFVSALSHGWTRSEVCVGKVRPDYVYPTVLWDPAGSAHRSCMSLHWYFWPDDADKGPWWLYYRDFTWAGKEE